eukprot:TRINITY_DN3196_c0_g1_i2.p1 TRINITY_DN3196_c0_g1~~TRINITY_DN3196_c0_g1_i2.p1  ORF type:complete len:115 (-),score=16.88 TRINITY_DN3196_c0_g1_i2:73-417(-)
MGELIVNNPNYDPNKILRADIQGTILDGLVHMSSLEMLDIFLKHQDINVNHKSGFGHPLSIAIKRGLKDKVIRLLNHPNTDISILNDFFEENADLVPPESTKDKQSLIDYFSNN